MEAWYNERGLEVRRWRGGDHPLPAIPTSRVARTVVFIMLLKTVECLPPVTADTYIPFSKTIKLKGVKDL